MKKLNLWLLASLFVSSLAFTACSSSNDDDGPGGGSGGFTPVPIQPVNPSDMTMAKLSGFVYEGTWPIAGVKVTSGTVSVTTNQNGAFTLPQVSVKNGRTVVKFEKDYYVDVVRSAVYKEGDVWDVQMKSRNTSYITPTVDNTIQPSSWSAPDMKVVIPAGELKTDDGSPITGQVEAQTTYLDPADDNFEAQMPGGDLVGIGNPAVSGAEEQLISYGMVSVSLTDQAGKSVNLKSKAEGGQGATIIFPAPTAGQEAYNEIPLWSFNEETGVWEYEGMATKQADGTYKGTVYHFSWHNLDYPESRATLKINVKDDTGAPVVNQRVVYGQSAATTDKDGNISVFVPTDTEFKVYVKSIDYSNYSPEVSETVAKITDPGSIKQVNLVLPKMAHLSGTITANGVGVQASASVTYSGGTTKPVMSAVDGKYFINLPAANVGAATLNIMAADGTTYSKNITLTGADMTANFEIVPPAVASGSVTFTSTDGTTTFTQTIYDVPAFKWGGVIIMGNEMMSIYSYDEKGYVDFSKYEGGGYFSYYNGTTGDNISSRGSSDFNLAYAVDGTKVNVTVSGSGTYSKNGTTFDGTISGSFPYSIAAFISPASVSAISSWIPTVTGATPKFVYTISNSSKLGDGCVLFYNNAETLNQFTSLVNAAKAAFGEPYDSSEDGEYMQSYTFIKGNQGLQLSWSNNQPGSEWVPGISEIMGGHHGWGACPITIRAYSNITVPYTDVFSGHFK